MELQPPSADFGTASCYVLKAEAQCWHPREAAQVGQAPLQVPTSQPRQQGLHSALRRNSHPSLCKLGALHKYLLEAALLLQD